MKLSVQEPISPLTCYPCAASKGVLEWPKHPPQNDEKAVGRMDQHLCSFGSEWSEWWNAREENLPTPTIKSQNAEISPPQKTTNIASLSLLHHHQEIGSLPLL